MIKLAVFDFDGVFTDGKVYFDHKGEVMKYYNAKDGMGIKCLRKAGVKVGVVSGYKRNSSQKAIFDHLNIDFHSMGSNDKVHIVEEWCKILEIDMSKVSFMGDDINDLDLLRTVGFSGCPADANKSCFPVVKYVADADGGNGCVREFCERLLEKLE